MSLQGCLQIDSIDFDCFDSIDRFDSIDSCLFGVSVGYLGVCLGFLGGSVPVWVMPGGCPGVLIDRFDRFDSFDFMIDSIDVRYYCVYGGLGERVWRVWKAQSAGDRREEPPSTMTRITL